MKLKSQHMCGGAGSGGVLRSGFSHRRRTKSHLEECRLREELFGVVREGINIDYGLFSRVVSSEFISCYQQKKRTIKDLGSLSRHQNT